jgi:hypothetical protein
VREDLFTNPRPVPGRLAPMLAGSALIVLALPIFAIAGFPLKGWALAGCCGPPRRRSATY